MKFKAPLIVVEDMARSRKFYEDILGQKVILDFGANITFQGDFSLQTKDTWMKFIGKTGSEIVSGSNSFELYFEEEAFDAFIERLDSRNLEVLHDVTEYSWGQKVIRFYDPDRHIIEVGESMTGVVRRLIADGLSVEQTAARTQHPVEFVKGCLRKA
ncbi:MAG TPA: glyoxalase [Peptococcaceae bacterium]|nr:glyoxalase [Peptococcaceae bacterium]